MERLYNDSLLVAWFTIVIIICTAAFGQGTDLGKKIKKIGKKLEITWKKLKT